MTARLSNQIEALFTSAEIGVQQQNYKRAVHPLNNQ